MRPLHDSDCSSPATDDQGEVSPVFVRDGGRRATAARIMPVFPRWFVMWGVYSREFWAFPCFGAPPGTVLHALEADHLAGMIHLEQRATADGSR